MTQVVEKLVSIANIRNSDHAFSLFAKVKQVNKYGKMKPF